MQCFAATASKDRQVSLFRHISSRKPALPENRRPLSPMRLSAARRGGCELHFFVNRPLERNETTKQMETAPITQATEILDCGMWDTLIFNDYAREYGKLK
jgi:hypothetical protein